MKYSDPTALSSGYEHFDLHGWPFYWLTQTHGQYLLMLERVLKEVELDVPRWRVLILLEGERARSISYLAREAISKLSTMTRIVQRMQDDELVITRPRASDQRVTEVALTSHGRRARVLALQQADKVYQKTFEGITEREVEELNRTLARIHANMR